MTAIIYLLNVFLLLSSSATAVTERWQMDNLIGKELNPELLSRSIKVVQRYTIFNN